MISYVTDLQFSLISTKIKLNQVSKMNEHKIKKLPHHCYVGKDVVSSKSKATDRPREGAICTVFLSNLYVEDTSNFLHSEYFKPDVDIRDLCIVIGEADCELDRGLEKSLCLMDEGEESKVTLSVNNQEITVFVKLIKVENPAPIFEWPDDKKLNTALLHKEKGNKLFKENRYIDAFHRFSKAVKLVIIVIDETVSGKNDLYLTLCNNMAACQLHFHNYDYVVDLCKKVLSRTPDNIKSLTRRMDAFIGLRDFENAHADATKILQLNPSNEYTKKKLEFVNKKLTEQHVRYVKMVKQMFV